MFGLSDHYNQSVPDIDNKEKSIERGSAFLKR